MNEGLPVRTIITMIIATFIAAAIIGLILIYFCAPSNYSFTAAGGHGAAQVMTAAFISIEAAG